MPGESAPPWASATDDVEGIIALKHEILGDIFDVKQFLDAQPKILSELTKRNFELPSFNEPSGEGIMERDSIESVCHREEIQVSLLPTEFPYPRGDN